jgi:hypothetical protein
MNKYKTVFLFWFITLISFLIFFMNFLEFLNFIIIINNYYKAFLSLTGVFIIGFVYLKFLKDICYK